MLAKSPFRLTSANTPAQPKKPDTLALGRMKAGVRNATEAEYEKLLETRRCLGEVLWYRFEGITLRIAKGVSYTPDFVVMLASGEIELHEVKGYWRDDARANARRADISTKLIAKPNPVFNVSPVGMLRMRTKTRRSISLQGLMSISLSWRTMTTKDRPSAATSPVL